MARIVGENESKANTNRVVGPFQVNYTTTSKCIFSLSYICTGLQLLMTFLNYYISGYMSPNYAQGIGGGGGWGGIAA